MAGTDFTQACIDKFLAAIEPLKDAYQRDSFSYVAINTDNGPVLIQGTLFLNVQSPAIPRETFQSRRIYAEHFLLRDIGLTREQVITHLSNGRLRTPLGELLFPPNADSNRYGAQYQPFHEVGLQTQSRLTHLTLLGAETRPFVEQHNLDWELRAAPVPFDGMQDLLNEFRLNAPQGVNCVEIAAFAVAVVDAASIVRGEEAILSVRIAATAVPEKVSVGIHIIEPGRVVARKQLAGSIFDWKDEGGFRVGTTTFPVSRGAVVHAFANYGGIAQQHYFFGDPTSFQNPRRAAYEAFDPKLAVIADILTKSQDARDSRSFEAAMPWLFWMLGFSPAHIGALPRTSDAVDFLVAAPNGNLAVVECTLGLLKEDQKLPKLHDRAQAVRRNLDTSSTRHVRVLPVIITAKTAEEVRPDAEQAAKLGIRVITREGIDRLLQQTLVPSNADALYEQAEREVRIAKEAHEA